MIIYIPRPAGTPFTRGISLPSRREYSEGGRDVKPL